MPKDVFAGDFRVVLGPLMATTDPLKAAADAGALLTFLDGCPAVGGRRVGAVGFCLGGGMAVAAAGMWPDRLAAEPYVGAAENDASCPAALLAMFGRRLRAGAAG